MPLKICLAFKKNNYPLPGLHNWELIAQEKSQNTLVTLFHSEPEPLSMRFVTQILLPNFGWPHTDAGTKYPETERRIGLTINNTFPQQGRGFKISVDYSQKRIHVDFDAFKIADSFEDWLPDRIVDQNNFQSPYWTFSTIEKSYMIISTTLYTFKPLRKKKVVIHTLSMITSFYL